MSNRLIDTRPIYPPDVLDCNTIITSFEHEAIRLRKLADEQASPEFREAVAEWFAAYGIVRAAGRKLMAERE